MGNNVIGQGGNGVIVGIVGRWHGPNSGTVQAWQVRNLLNHWQIFQGKVDVLIKNGTAGQGGGMTAGADYGGTDGLAAQSISALTKTAAGNGFAQNRAYVAKGQVWVLGLNTIGYTTGKMAAKILKGEADIAEMQIEYAEKFTKKYNPEIAEEFGFTPEELEAKGYIAIKK